MLRTHSVRCASVLMVAALLTGCADHSSSNSALTGPSVPGSTQAKPSAQGGPGVNAGPETLPVPVVTPNVSVCEQVSITWTNVPTTPSGHVALSWHVMLFVWDGDEWIQVTQTPNHTQASFQSALQPGLYQFRVKPNGQGGVTNYNGGFEVVQFTVTECANVSEGCSPGYWKNLTQHADMWQVYAPSQEFLAVFGRSITVGAGGQNTLTDPSLVEALQATGGGVSRVARIGTAALLSAAHSGVNYPYSTAQVVTAVQNAIDGVSGPVSIDDLENVWKLNPDPSHCPLGNDPVVQ